MIYLGKEPVGISVEQNNLELLRTLTFINALGSDGRQAVDCSECGVYDFLLFVPDLVVTPQEGQTSGNWLWYSITDGTTTGSNYNATGAVGVRGALYTAVLIHGYSTSRSKNGWTFQPLEGGRDAFIKSDAPLENLTITYGSYYGTTYAYLNGTVKIYGGKFME